jgi:hypothetical protein
MLRKRLIISVGSAVATAALTLAGVAAATSASASTTDVLTYGSVGGTNVAVKSVLTSSLRSGTDATFYTGTTSPYFGVSCSTGSSSQTVSTNPAAGGTADLSTTSQSFSYCSQNLGEAYTIEEIDVTTPYASTVSPDGSTIPSSTAVLEFSFDHVSYFCYYKGTNLSGTAKVTNQKYVETSGPLGESSLCAADVYFSATYKALADTSVSGDPAVYLNT